MRADDLDQTLRCVLTAQDRGRRGRDTPLLTAGALHERGLAIREKALGPEHPDVAASLANLGIVHKSTGDYPQARALYERALAIREKALGPEHPNVALGLYNLGNLHISTGDYPQARALHERALAIREKTFGPEDLSVTDSLLGLADVALAQSRPADAVPLAERAVSVREKGGVAAEHLAEARFALARASWAAPLDRGRDRARAVQLATAARDAYRVTKGHEKPLAEVEAWLRRVDSPQENAEKK